MSVLMKEEKKKSFEAETQFWEIKFPQMIFRDNNSVL